MLTPTQNLVLSLLVAATLLPLLSSVLLIFLGKRVLGKASGWVATAVMGAAFVCAAWALVIWFRPEWGPPPERPVATQAARAAKTQTQAAGRVGAGTADSAAAPGMDRRSAGRGTRPGSAVAATADSAAEDSRSAGRGTQVGHPATIVYNIPWLPIAYGQGADGIVGVTRWLHLGVLIDSLTVAMMGMVTFIAFLVHLYSIGYMAGDARFERFFAYLSLFSFSMLGIVMSNSLLELFVFWELVGLTSYLLIGFWFEKRGPQLACKKAFVMNRIGDAGFLIGFGILFYQLGGRVLLPAAEGVVAADGERLTSVLGALTKPAAEGGLGLDILNPPLWLTAAGIGIFFGAIGKSAQFPLHTWLPDAMEGPTPVSSIVHSATMVAAGVYLTARVFPILSPGAHLFVATIGLITLVIAACMALVMHDIKRVLAYSTLSQLGYMILGLGAGAYSFALFHLITHAFFKCCLFQCAGSVIHGAHHQQDMRYYGGLARKMPATAVAFFVCLLAIAGASIPFTNWGMSGFYSKDGIIAGAFLYGEAMQHHGWAWAGLFYWGPLCVAYLTVFYMARSFALTFLGQPRDKHLFEHAHEAPWTMVVPQLLLATMAVIAAVLPFLALINESMPAVEYVLPGEEAALEHGFHFAHHHLLYGLGWIAALGAGVGLFATAGGQKVAGRFAALPGVRLVHTWFLNKFYFDALYDGFAVGAGKTLAYLAALFDTYVVDQLVNLAGLAGKGAAWVTGKVDDRVVDGAVNGAAAAAQAGGAALRTTQPGRIRFYVMMLFSSAAGATVVVVLVTLVR